MKELEVLKQAMVDAKAKAVADPSDKKLQVAAEEAEQAYNDAKAALDTGTGDQVVDPDEIDDSKLDEKTKKYLAKLRKENATHRTKGKDLKSKLDESETKRKAILKAAGISEDDSTPEEKLKDLETKNQTQTFRTAVLELALEHGIPKDQLDFFKFMVSEAANELEEGEELDDDKLAEIVAKVKKAGGKSANSTVAGSEGKGNPKPGVGNEITLEKFCSMSITEKSKLYLENASKYEELMTAAKGKKKLV